MLLELGASLLILAILPYVVYLLGVTAGRKLPAAPIPSSLPPVSIVIAAYNEAAVLERRLANLSRSSYPRDLYEVILVDDCSTDGTRDIAEATLERLGIRHRVVANTERLGPARSYNRAISLASHDIVVTTDADVFFEQDALLLLIARLVSDHAIVAVCGDLRPLPDRTSTRAMESVYRGYYGRMCDWESAIDACYTFNGALVAFKRSEIQRIEDRRGADDANTAFEAIRRGRRAVYEIRAVVFEEIPEGIPKQYRQKVRRATGLIEATLNNLDLLRSDRPFSRFVYPLRIWMFLFTPAIFSAGSILALLGLLLIAPLFAAVLVAGLVATMTLFRTAFLNAFVFNQICLLMGLLKLGTDVRAWESTSRKSPN